MSTQNKPPSLLSDSLFLVGSVAILVTTLLGTFSFALSYTAMRELAKSSGAVVDGLDILWPLVVDFAMIVFGTVAIFRTLRQQGSFWQRALVILFSLLSILFNVLHSPNRWQSQLVAAMPPFALVLAIESIISMITSILIKGKAEKANEVASRDRMIAEQNRQIEELERQLTSYVQPVQQDAPAVMQTCFCGYTGDDLDSHNGLHVYQVRQVRTPEQGVQVLRNLYPSANGNLPGVEIIAQWQAAIK